MIIDWTRNLKTDEEKSSFVALLKNSTILDRIRELVAERERTIERIDTSTDSYDTPSWAHKQAHLNGRREELTYLKRLLDIDKGT